MGGGEPPSSTGAVEMILSEFVSVIDELPPGVWHRVDLTLRTPQSGVAVETLHMVWPLLSSFDVSVATCAWKSTACLVRR